MADAIIEVKDVEFRYEGAEEDAVAGVSLRVERGEFVAVLGRNGSGKSTLAKLLNALNIPQKGEIWIDGVAAHEEENSLEVRKRCGMVFQNPDNQIVATVVEEDCAFGLENLGVPPEDIRRRVDDALEAVGMREYAEAAPHMLSGGQKQRVAIAGVLAMRPQIIVFDESTAMLDPSGRREVFAVAEELNRRDGITIVWITHFMDEALRAGRLLVMDAGKVALEGAPREVFEKNGRDTQNGAGRAAHGAAGGATARRWRPPARGHHDRGRNGGGTVSIEIRGLTHIYMPGTPFETRALDNVSLTIRDGDFVGVIGHTGSGKSTLIVHLNALIRPEPGHVLVGGVDVGEKGQSLIEIRREVGLVFQYPEYQLFEETVEKDVGFGPRNLGLDEETVKARVREAIAQVGLGEDILEKSPFELSGGQKRRVAIAGVLAMKPGTLVLDEPVAGLDPAGREELLSLIQGIHKGGVTIVMVTHSMDDAARFCDRLIVLDHGRVAFDAAPGEVFRHEEELRQMGLDVPECVKLVKALKARGMDLGEGLYRMEDVRAAILREVGKC